MKTSLIHTLLTASLLSAATAATTYNENFDASTSLPTGWSATGDAAVAVDGSIARSGSNYLTMGTRDSNSATTQTFDFTGATESTISFYWTTTGTYSSAFGRIPEIQYSSDGTTFATIGTIAVPSSNTGTPPYTLFSTTITDATYSFTANSVYRIVGDNNSGGAGAPLIVDDLSITSIPEPSASLLGGLGCLLLVRRRRA